MLSPYRIGPPPPKLRRESVTEKLLLLVGWGVLMAGLWFALDPLNSTDYGATLRELTGPPAPSPHLPAMHVLHDSRGGHTGHGGGRR